MRLSVQAVAHHSDCPEEVGIEAEERQQQAEYQPTSDRRAAECTGTERMTDDQVSLARHRHDQPHRVVTYLNTHATTMTSAQLRALVFLKRTYVIYRPTLYIRVRFFTVGSLLFRLPSSTFGTSRISYRPFIGLLFSISFPFCHTCGKLSEYTRQRECRTRHYCIAGVYSSVHTTRVHGTRLALCDTVSTGRVHGPYIRASFWTPVFTDCGGSWIRVDDKTGEW